MTIYYSNHLRTASCKHFMNLIEIQIDLSVTGNFDPLEFFVQFEIVHGLVCEILTEIKVVFFFHLDMVATVFEKHIALVCNTITCYVST